MEFTTLPPDLVAIKAHLSRLMDMKTLRLVPMPDAPDEHGDRQHPPASPDLMNLEAA